MNRYAENLGRKRCHAVGCEELIQRDFLMCYQHWSMVPKEVQKEVHATLRYMNRGGSAALYVLATTRAQLVCVEQETHDPKVAAALRSEIEHMQKKGSQR
jgi:hypothetical protein